MENEENKKKKTVALFTLRLAKQLKQFEEVEA